MRYAKKVMYAEKYLERERLLLRGKNVLGVNTVIDFPQVTASMFFLGIWMRGCL